MTMRLLIVASLAAVVAAHFKLQFPSPRGPFVEDDEPTFCDGYKDATTNRTEFPLTGGFFSLDSEHEDWTGGVFLATTANPVVADFKQIVSFFSVKGAEGPYCAPLPFTSSNASGLTNGQNVTIQVVFNGGDGSLFQCSDLTLSDSFKISSDIECKNTTAQGGSPTGNPSTTVTAPGSPSPTETGQGSALKIGGRIGVISTFVIGAIALACL